MAGIGDKGSEVDVGLLDEDQSATAPGGTPVSEVLSTQILSLPMHPYLDEAT